MEIQELLNRLDGVKSAGTNKWQAHCPCKKNHAHGDKNRSLSVSLSGTKILMYCHTGCTKEEICAAIRIEEKDLFTDAPQKTTPTKEEQRQSSIEWYASKNNLRVVASYSYCYGDYQDGLTKVKYVDADTRKNKTFRWIHDDQAAPFGVAWNHENCPHRLYVAGDIDADEVFCVEGEKDAYNLHLLTGKTVVSAENGAQRKGEGNKWLPEYSDQLAGKTVVILFDNDEVGKDFAQIEANAIAKNAKSVRMIDIASEWKDCPEKGDISDMITALGEQESLTILQRLVNNAPEWMITVDIPEEAPAAEADAPEEPPKMDSVQLFDSFMDKIQTEAYKPIQTGMGAFDRLLGGGILRQSLVILSAAPGTGKTTLAQQIFEAMAKNGNDVVFLNLEMSREQLLARSLSRIVKKNGGTLTASGILQGYHWDADQRKHATQAAKEYRETIAGRMRYNPDGCTTNLDSIIATLTKEAEAAKQAGKNAPVCVLDYLHLVTTDKREDQTEIIKKTVAALKEYAIKYGTFVFAISATNRTSNQRGTISLESGRDSSALEYTGDIMLSLNYAALHDRTKIPVPQRDEEGNLTGRNVIETADASNPDHMEYLQKQKPRQMLVQVLKNRMNEPGGKLYLAFDAASSQFTEVIKNANMEAPKSKWTVVSMGELPFDD